VHDAGERLLRIYLNDHLAGSAGAIALARRMLRSNQGGELARFLAGLLDELAEDRASLEQVVDALGYRRSPVKEQAVKLAVRAGRLKLNGRLRGYSDLSRVLELEGLLLWIAAKRGLWTALAETGRSLPVDLDELRRRAERQGDGVEEQRRDAVLRAFGTGS
jgi:hypothetical protein